MDPSTSQHRYHLTGVITAPVLNESGHEIGICTISGDGKIEAQIHGDLSVQIMRELLIYNLADGLTIHPHVVPAKPSPFIKKEIQDAES